MTEDTDPVEIWMHECDVVVTGDDVAQGRQPLLHPLDAHCVWQAVSDVLQLLIRRVVRNQKTVTISYTEQEDGQLRKHSTIYNE